MASWQHVRTYNWMFLLSHFNLKREERGMSACSSCHWSLFSSGFPFHWWLSHEGSLMSHNDWVHSTVSVPVSPSPLLRELAICYIWLKLANGLKTYGRSSKPDRQGHTRACLCKLCLFMEPGQNAMHRQMNNQPWQITGNIPGDLSSCFTFLSMGLNSIQA